MKKFFIGVLSMILVIVVVVLFLLMPLALIDTYFGEWWGFLYGILLLLGIGGLTSYLDD